MSGEQINLTIDGQALTVPKGTTVYTAALKLGIQIPIFCYQDRMPPFGACRMCLVEVEKIPKLQASCVLEATEGMVVKTQSQVAVDGRKGIIEFLLINHPLDCPICDRGGECPLQEQALDHGPGSSRFFEQKRKFPKRKPLGPVLMLDRERCIQCARCTRFGDVLAGDHALEFIDRGYRMEVGTPDGGPAESKFIGNTIMICPVGALTSQVYRFRARPWDNQPTNSTCTLCPVGCSMILDQRDGEIMRTRSQEDKAVNDIWLCDKGWFGYEFVYHPERLKTPLAKKNGKLEPISWDEAFSLAAEKLKAAKQLAAFGGSPLTTEELYLFQKLIREGCQSPNVDYRIGQPIFSLEEEGAVPGMVAGIETCETLEYIVLAGLDLTEEFPVLWLRLRQAINKGAKMVFVGHFEPEIGRYCSENILHAPGDELDALKKLQVPSGKRGAIFVGSQYLANPQRKMILSTLQGLQLPLHVMEGKNNSQGARLAGMHPELLPLGQKAVNKGFNAVEALSNPLDLLWVAGANPALKFPKQLWESARQKMGFLIVQDLFLTETAQVADLVLPTLSFIEKGGHFTNIEGRTRTLLPGKEIPEQILSDGEIFTQIATKLSFPLQIASNFLAVLEKSWEPLKAQPPITSTEGTPYPKTELAASFAPKLFDRGVRMNHDPHLMQLSKKPYAWLNPSEGVKRNMKDGAAVTLNGIKAEVHFDPKVAAGTVVLPLGFKELPVYELGAQLLNGLPITLVPHGNTD